MATTLGIDTKPLRFAYSRLNSLLRTLQVRSHQWFTQVTRPQWFDAAAAALLRLRALQVTSVDEFTPLQLVADFATLLATYPVGFMVITEPYNPKTPHIPDPVMQVRGKRGTCSPQLL